VYFEHRISTFCFSSDRSSKKDYLIRHCSFMRVSIKQFSWWAGNTHQSPVLKPFTGTHRAARFPRYKCRNVGILHHLWHLVSRTLFVKGLNWMPRGLKVSQPLTVNMIPFVNIRNIFKWNNIYILTSRVAHWDMLDDSHCVLVCKEKIFFERTNGKCHLYTLSVNW
jgi:hypothetical protein